ncbi:tetratricopeptide repeat protein [Ferrovibrio sp.]|uniref:tetratricopeptide repeat protein n=1 Tax=Ferrovibrio sp. TaxID=1917215 RepID=UPI003518A7AE
MNRKQRRAQEKMAASGRPAGPSAALATANRLNDRALDEHRAGRSAEAIALLREAIAAYPANAIYHNNLGELLRMSGDAATALPCFDQAIRLQPRYAQAHNNRGNALRDLKQPAEAVACYQVALAIQPDYAEALNNMGAALMDSRDFTGAAEALRKAIALNPGIAMFHQNLGLTLSSLDRPDEALRAFAEAVRLDPGLIDTQIALGDLARSQGDFAGTMRWYEQAIRLQPGHGAAHMRYGTALMVKGDYKQAWPHFGARWTVESMKVDMRPFTLPFWQGQPLPDGGKMLLFTEQGVGETLALLSVMPELLATGIRPVIECDPRMIPLLQRSFPGLEVLPRTNPAQPRLFAPDLVIQGSLFDVAAVFRRSPADCTGALPLKADAERAAALRARYQQGDGRPLVGVAWYSANPQIGAPKSAQLTDFAAFLGLPGLRFVDLQYGNREADRAALKQAAGVDLLVDPEIDQMKDLDGFAAQIEAMDMVVTTSNTTAHMAGALGKPAIVMLHKGISPHWYWGLDGNTTPWYRSLTLLRQTGPGDWAEVARRVAEQLSWRLPAAG